ncbi:hypothetical protein [Allomuricauda sp.]|uniref:hypothetical protein n=1 Tax=Flagellimonas sp. TaxID=2058762 RepID=UPI00181BFD6C|nr:hypothetical protein [Allomuricauda sp.]MBA4746232.1 hypothetical protein [Allomuricauda sp.]
MNFIITVKKSNERIDNVVLENTTEVDSIIELGKNKYQVKEIIIVNPDEGIIELKCWNITNSGKSRDLTTTWN